MGASGTEDYSPAGTLGQVLSHAMLAPDRPALKDDEEALSYAQLAARSRAGAAGLAALGAGPGQRVALLLDNSAAFVSAALSCMWVGAPFVPLSPESPPAHLAAILADCRPSLVVAQDGSLPSGAVPPGSPTPAAVAPAELWAEPSRRAPAPADGAERDVYLIYTSGTTGTPKGVRVSERALACAIAGAVVGMGLDTESRSMSISSFTFDGSYGTLFPTLVAGGTLHVPPRPQLLFLRRFFRDLDAERITHTSSSPSYLRMLLASPWADKLRGSSLRCYALGGEELAAADVARLWELAPQAVVVNRYGPTEATIAVTHYVVTPADVAAGKLPIGVPQPGNAFHIVGPGGTLIETPGEVGELYISGRQLMSGYWADEAVSAQVLRSDVTVGALAYKTGDLVYRDEQGRYFYYGRSDDVVKRRGHRISLTEVAGAIAALDGVREAVCLAEGTGAACAIVAFVRAPPGASAHGLLDALSQRLPHWMLPDKVEILERLPLSPAGKVDRAALRSSSPPQGR